jgi:putative solute:sodium symporter small subunit
VKTLHCSASEAARVAPESAIRWTVARPTSPPAADRHQEKRPLSKPTYWQANLRLVSQCLVVWFVVSFGFGILGLDWLNRIEINGLQLGFWFAQQGSIFVFVALIFFYAWRMAKIDREHGVEED